ncbi:unnamed protein product, partial [Dracunculus medinensis]|uniref:Rhomboid domain-containing protein n=1 Tax=Dracunculus medinensis TaxID=318479 RepID=A0A0N4U485_DRAME
FSQHKLRQQNRFGIGFGLWRKYFKRKLKHTDQFIPDSYVDYRPFFTYWVTSVQMLVTVVSLLIFGFGPYGFGRIERTADVLHSSITLKHVSIYEQGNFWLGPSFMNLVHLGAKFSPCMRHDKRIYAQIKLDRDLERETGCCIYNDGTGCFQTSYNTCPFLSFFRANFWCCLWTRPEVFLFIYCDRPSSVDPFEWPDDITEWPICRTSAAFIPENQKHLLCEVTGRPCCIQLHGQCRITTRDYCDFVQGFFHENATLCSQVSCLGDVCGMLPFLDSRKPDQFYRLFIPLFLHAGIFHCVFTIIIQWHYMRDLEKLIGWARMAILYIGSGVAGNLASAIFVPYKPEVGPAGSHIGIFAAMYTDVVYNWAIIAEPWKAIRELNIFMFFLFISGVLPWIDNWAHLFGFIFGLLLSLATFPYIQRGKNVSSWRLMIVVTTLTSASGLFILMLFIFYGLSDFDCPYCEYFNCIPFSPHFCDNQGLRLQSWLPI